MEAFQIDDLKINLNVAGAGEFSKVSYSLRYGHFNEISTPKYIFQFNLNGEIKFITGRGKSWPDPSEWLKRTVTNDWIYYSTGGYSGVYDSLGEYYLPCLPYPSNSINSSDPFSNKAVSSAIDSWHELHEKITTLYSDSLPNSLKSFFNLVIVQSPENLKHRSRSLRKIIGDRITVLPPDSRHVDYEVIPVIVADGCLYKCGFCRVKSRLDFLNRSREDIKSQIKGLKVFYGSDITNYNAIFLAQHDALHAGEELLEFAAGYAYKAFEVERSNLKGASLYLFGSVDSILNSNYTLFDRLEELPFSTYINIGLESADEETLAALKKAITPETVGEAFARILEINRRYKKIEITANFLFGDNLPKGHLPSFFQLIEKNIDRPLSKGAIYFSPMINGAVKERRGIKREFYKLKVRSRLPTFLYLIQRL
ncbi:MAG: radical SAM domain-containing protein [Deltaproteobacteria bacterium]|nr:radical SAM domain-containing protein [Deltaproteobacteria bacterium]